MKEPLHKLWQDYAPVAAEYLRRGGEERLNRAYELGRQALSNGLGLLDTAEIHRAAVSAAFPDAQGEAIQRELALFAQALGPFEMALRGYQDAIAGLKRMAASLEEQVAARTQQALAAEARFRSLVEHLPAATYVATLSPGPQVTYLSPQAERMFGYPVEAWMGSLDAWTQRIHPEDRERLRQAWERGLTPGVAQRAEYRFLAEGGRTVWIRDEAVILEPHAGQPLRRQGFIVDITEQRLLEEQLRQSQKMDAIGRLAGGVAHDFNNLLTVILTFSDLRLRELPEGDDARADLEEIKKAGERAAALTRQLLAFSRQQVIELTPLDLNGVLANMDKMFRRVLGEDIQLATVAAPDLARVNADVGQMEQVLMNLVVNARDAMPEGGRLTIETANVMLDEAYAREHPGASAGPHVMMAVSDTGTGMSRETQARIFEPFFTTKEKGKGTGLGLSTVFGIVKQHGGTVYVYSEAGKGSTFKVYLPRIESEGAVAASKTSSPPPGHETILLIEDEAPVRDAAKRILSRAGYQVLAAENANDARRICREHPGAIDLVLSDVVMPEMSGPKLVEELGALRAGMKVLFMSGYTDDAVVRHGILNSESAFVQKPLTPDGLVEKIRARLRTSA